jgi:hypothetical protein
MTGSMRTNASAIEYDMRLFILPEHPYNLRLFISRLEPLYRQQFSTQTNNVESSKGAVFRYKKKPFFFNMRYVENLIESENNFSDVKTFGVNGLYFKEYKDGKKLSLSASFDHSSYDASSGLKGTSDNYTFNNSIDLKTAALDTSLSKNTFRQENATGRVDSDQSSWFERLTINLPLNFRSILSYHYLKNKSSYESQDSLSDTNKGYELNITHKLYKSLDTTYIFRNDSTNSSSGDVTVTSHALMASYSKSIPWGMLLAGIGYNRASTDNAGNISVSNESHSATIGFPFTLFGQNPDPATIHVYLKDPLPPFEPIPLKEVIHYLVTPLGNTYQITVTDLPPPFRLDGTYEFIVSYSLKSGDFRLQTTSFSYNAGLNLFNNLINPYFSCISTNSKVLSGTFTGIPVDETLTTVGIIFQKAPFRVQGEYQVSDSNINAYRLWRADVNYSNPVTATSRVYLAAVLINKRYTGGTSLIETGAYTEKTTTLSANLQKQFLERSLVFSAGGTYSSFQGLTTSSTYSLNSSLEWKIGKVSISLGASGYSSKSEGLSGITTERIHQYYYANIKRKLF